MAMSILMPKVENAQEVYKKELLAPPVQKRQYFLKRPLDIIGAIMLLIMFSPALIVAIMAIKLTSPGPVFFKQKRVGFKGKEFMLYKFRTMIFNGEVQESELEMFDSRGNLIFKVKDDPRITKVGKVLRKAGIDELPQLFNVLKGQMSLVGPRPHIALHVEIYQPWQYRRLAVKPGITGLWLIEHGSNMIDHIKATRSDLHYIENWSLQLDIKILLRTVPFIFLGFDRVEVWSVERLSWRLNRTSNK